MNKEEITYLIHKENVMRKAHDHLVDSLVGTLHHEYTGQWVTPPTAMQSIQPPPIFRAVINMLIAQMLHHFAEDIIDKIVDIIVSHQETEHRP